MNTNAESGGSMTDLSMIGQETDDEEQRRNGPRAISTDEQGEDVDSRSNFRFFWTCFKKGSLD